MSKSARDIIGMVLYLLPVTLLAIFFIVICITTGAVWLLLIPGIGTPLGIAVVKMLGIEQEVQADTERLLRLYGLDDESMKRLEEKRRATRPQGYSKYRDRGGRHGTDNSS